MGLGVRGANQLAHEPRPGGCRDPLAPQCLLHGEDARERVRVLHLSSAALLVRVRVRVRPALRRRPPAPPKPTANSYRWVGGGECGRAAEGECGCELAVGWPFSRRL